MNVIFTVLLVCVFFFLSIAYIQHKHKPTKQKIKLPIWLAKLFGGSTGYLDIGLFCFQLFWILVFFWSIPIGLMLPQGQYRGDLFWIGFRGLLVGVFVLFLVLRFFTKQ